MLERYSPARRPALFAGLIIGMLGGGAARQHERPTLHVVPQLDVKRYAGTWYEVARLPNEFQDQCASDVTATYTLEDDGDVQVVNRCRNGSGDLETAEGVARRVEGAPPSILEVRFAPAILSLFPQVWGDYQVMALSPSYEWALVGTPDRKHLWLLSRTPTLSDDVHRQLTTEASRQGFDVSRLRRTSHTQQDGRRTASSDCEPVERDKPNAPQQQPSFAGQTRACAMTSEVEPRVTVLTTGLEHPWAVEPLPNGDLLVTERPGRMRVITSRGVMGEPVAGVPKVDARDQGGLLDVALSPSFAQDRLVFWSFSEPRQGGNGTSIARGTLSPDGRRLTDVRVILRTQPTYDGTKHFGSRLAFGPDDLLYVTLGDRYERETRPHAQQLDSHLGKILRIRPDGSVPPDNPFANDPNARPEIWTLGHRNVQAAAFDADGQLWTVEHGARGGDELNTIVRGENYGWPLVSFGIEYTGEPISNAVTERTGYEAPIYYWDPVIAPSGAQFYSGRAFPAWRGHLLIGGLTEDSLVRLRLDGQRVTGEERLFGGRGQRIRDVRQGADGSIYIVTDERNGQLWRVTPGDAN